MPVNKSNILAEVAERFGTPAYVYFLDDIAERSAMIERAFGGRLGVNYAVKANPNRALLRELSSMVAALDVSSGGEVRRGLQSGYPAHKLSFSGPGKSQGELALAVSSGCGEIITESLGEISDLDRIARECGRRASILIRVSPQKVPKGFGVSMGRRPSQFGIDEEELDEALLCLPQFKSLDFVGFHIYAGTQCLDGNSILENFENYIRIFIEFGERHNLTVRRLVLGGGIGIPYHGESPVDLVALGLRLNPMLDSLRSRPLFSGADLRLEIGRLLVGQAGTFITRVRRTKFSRGKEIAICDGGLNNHLAACGHFGSVIHRNYVIEKVSSDSDGGNPAISYDLFGPLCTTIDQLGRDVRVGALKTGDLLAVKNSGAYGLSASPMQFISHEPAKEIIVAMKNGTLEIIDATEMAEP